MLSPTADSLKHLHHVELIVWNGHTMWGLVWSNRSKCCSIIATMACQFGAMHIQLFNQVPDGIQRVLLHWKWKSVISTWVWSTLNIVCNVTKHRSYSSHWENSITVFSPWTIIKFRHERPVLFVQWCTIDALRSYVLVQIIVSVKLQQPVHLVSR